MPERAKAFADRLFAAHGNDICAIAQIGSGEGARDLTISDLDFFILVRKRKKAGLVFAHAHAVQQEVYGVRTSCFNRLVQRFCLGSCAFGGIHLIVVGQDELDDRFQPKSRRLRVLTALIGRNIFLRNVSRNHRLLAGTDIGKAIKPQLPHRTELFSCFLFPTLILILTVPLLFCSARSAKIWSMKAIKYHHQNLSAYLELTEEHCILRCETNALAEKYRYHPDACPLGRWRMFGVAWGAMLSNLRQINQA